MNSKAKFTRHCGHADGLEAECLSVMQPLQILHLHGRRGGGASAPWREPVAELNTEGSVELQQSSESAHHRNVCTWEHQQFSVEL